MTTAVKVWFCITVATAAAAIADTIVEGASNAGSFGPGTLTDHSEWDIIPLLSTGLTAAILFWLCRVYRSLHGVQLEASRLSVADTIGSGLRLLPAIYSLQIVILFAMETLEQLVVYHRLLGGSIWLGGPAIVSLIVHGIVCIFVALGSALLLRAFADATVRLVRLISSFANVRPRNPGLGCKVICAQSKVVTRLRIFWGLAWRAPPARV